MVQKSDAAIQEIELKLKQDMREIEDLIFQIKYFVDSSPSVDYSASMIKNLGKQVLDLLNVETSDIEHLFLQDKKQWQHKPFVFKKKLSHLHKELEKKDVLKIKNEVQKIVQAGEHAKENKIPKAELKTKVENSCSKILKYLNSEQHELGLVKDILKFHPLMKL